jgi:branched-chain amino acid transport system substrate-binding protein
MTARALMREFSRRQHSPDFRFDVPPEAPDLASHRRAILESTPGAVLIVAQPDSAARLLLDLRATLAGAQQPPCQIFGTPSMACQRFVQLAGDAAEGVRLPTLAQPDPGHPPTARFIQRFTAQRQRPPDDAALLTYDATRLLIEAIRTSGPSRARLRETLATLGPWRGVAGVIQFDGTGQNTRTNVGMATVRQGHFVFLDPHAPTAMLATNPTPVP